MTKQLRREDAATLLEKWYSVADACVPPNSVKFFAPNAKVQFNGMEPAVGKDAIQAFFKSVADLLHYQKRRSLNLDVVENRIYDETEHILIVKDDPEKVEVKIHQMNVYDVVPQGEPDAGLFVSWMAFTERTELFQRLEAAKFARQKRHS